MGSERGKKVHIGLGGKNISKLSFDNITDENKAFYNHERDTLNEFLKTDRMNEELIWRRRSYRDWETDRKSVV